MRQFTPPVSYVHPRQRANFGDYGISAEGSRARVPGDDRWHDLNGLKLSLPVIDRYSPSTYFEVFSTGPNPSSWNVSVEPFVQLSQNAGTLAPDASGDVRVYVTIDWDNAPESGSTLMNFSADPDYGTQSRAPSLELFYNNTAATNATGFMEGGGYIVIEPEHYSGIREAGNVSYQLLPGYGRSLSALTLNDSSTPSLTAEDAPALEYDFYKFTEPSANASEPTYFNLTAVMGTGLNSHPGRPLAFAAQFDDEEARRIEYIGPAPPGRGARPDGWSDAVYNAAWVNTTNWEDTLEVGQHTLKVYLLEPGTVLTRIMLDFGGLRDSYLGPKESVRLD